MKEISENNTYRIYRKKNNLLNMLAFSYFYNKNKVWIYFKVMRNCVHLWSLVLFQTNGV